MEVLKQSFKNAALYDEYVHAKMYAQSNIIWGFLGLGGSLISYFLLLLADALAMEEAPVSAGIGALWWGIVGAGLFFTTYISPEDLATMDQKPSSSSFLWIAWFLGMGLGAVAEAFLAQMGLIEVNALFAVTFGLFIGNSANFYAIREKLMLLAPIFNLLTAAGILLAPYPYEILVFGLGLWFPYYLSGFIIYHVQIPKMFKT